MKTITNDPQDFIENGGWSFLEPDSSVSLLFSSSSSGHVCPKATHWFPDFILKNAGRFCRITFLNGPRRYYPFRQLSLLLLRPFFLHLLLQIHLGSLRV